MSAMNYMQSSSGHGVMQKLLQFNRFDYGKLEVLSVHENSSDDMVMILREAAEISSFVFSLTEAIYAALGMHLKYIYNSVATTLKRDENCLDALKMANAAAYELQIKVTKRRVWE